MCVLINHQLSINSNLILIVQEFLFYYEKYAPPPDANHIVIGYEILFYHPVDQGPSPQRTKMSFISLEMPQTVKCNPRVIGIR
jgi:hypothetical protein